MSATRSWLEVDREGLRLSHRGGATAAVLDLISNSIDAEATMVSIGFEMVGRGLAHLTCEDNAPGGFADLTHAYTMYAPSSRKADATKRGRFNIGEKLVLAHCVEATIDSASGRIVFGEDGRSEVQKSTRTEGTLFDATARFRKVDVEEAIDALRRVIPPANVEAFVNGEPLAWREAITETAARLPTELEDDEGFLRPTRRKATVRIHRVPTGEQAMLYELGIPVVEFSGGEPYHVDVLQKVPLNKDRDNVTPGFLREVRTVVLDATHQMLDQEQASATWARDGMPKASDAAVESVMTHRFGEKRVAHDPGDPEASGEAASRGYTVIHGGSMSRDEWDAAKRTGAVLPAPQVTPTQRPEFGSRDDAATTKDIPPADWSDGQKRIAAYAVRFAAKALGIEVRVTMTRDKENGRMAAWYARGVNGSDLTFNVATLGQGWFDDPDPEAVDRLLIHEFAHQWESNHFSHDFHDACCRVGAARVAAKGLRGI
ncbi:MAG TPA: ATP-binding protein [Acidimicrobiales bacterium]|nr:ATP-binding protein [Acidimicrobiales bacterium]